MVPEGYCELLRRFYKIRPDDYTICGVLAHLDRIVPAYRAPVQHARHWFWTDFVYWSEAPKQWTSLFETSIGATPARTRRMFDWNLWNSESVSFMKEHAMLDASWK